MTTICDPRAEIGVPITPYDLSLDVTRPGLRIALVSNGFPDATNLLRAVGLELSGRLAEPEIHMFERFDASVVVASDVLKEIERSSDAAVTAMGHCGSCTTSAVRDSVLVAETRRPAVALVSEKFRDLSQFVARAAGMPDVPRVWLPHPVAGQGSEHINQVAAAIAGDVVEALRGRR